ncbi:MAG: cobalt transporter CbiM [Planctomycetes bacterium]|nr:cobalt transporter CbiM [Planctomycetota bacterium]
MMHLPDGVISNTAAGASWAVCSAGVAIGLRGMKSGRIPLVGVTAAVFFVCTLIAIPLPPASVHLLLNGLTGILLGWASFPAILVALALQAVQFGHGGVFALGANTVVMSVPAVICGALFSRRIKNSQTRRAAIYGFAAGALSVFLSCIMQASLLCLTDRGFVTPAMVLLGAHMPVMFIDGAVTAWVVGFLHRVKPEMLDRLD